MRDFFYDLGRMLGPENKKSRGFYWAITIATVIIFILVIAAVVCTCLGLAGKWAPLAILITVFLLVLVIGMWVYLAKRY